MKKKNLQFCTYICVKKMKDKKDVRKGFTALYNGKGENIAVDQ